VRSITYTLVTDGPSDRALMGPIGWLWRGAMSVAAQGQWFDPRPLPRRPPSLVGRIRLALELFPCDVLFVHRDAEVAVPQLRRREIDGAVHAAVPEGSGCPHVCVVPVRMSEAWLLFNEDAIRRAAGNPNGRAPLGLPSVRALESLPDPKSVLFEAMRTASGRRGRRLARMSMTGCQARLAEVIGDYSPLRSLPAFRLLEADLRSVARVLSVGSAGARG
jgi:hypothetical protein